jgi:ATP-dependent helicase HrpA
MIKCLPKSLRRQFVPAPDFARRALALMQPGEQPLRQALGAALRQLTGVQVPEDQWAEARLDDYLRMRIRLLSADGMEILAVSRDLSDLQRDYGDRVDTGAGAVALPDNPLEREGLRAWSFDDLPERYESEANGLRLTLWPALVDEGDSVALRCLDSQARAAEAQRAGIRRLLILRMGATARDLKRRIPGIQLLRLQYAKVPPCEGRRSGPGEAPSLEEQLLALSFERAFLEGRDASGIRTRAAFDACYEAGRGRLIEVHEHSLELVRGILGEYQSIRKALAGMNALNWIKAVRDMQQQLDGLVCQGFLQTVPAGQLVHYPRYLKALGLRIDKLRSGGQARDSQCMAEMADLWRQWRERDRQARERGRHDPRLVESRWALEELRVSLFAQELGARMPVSVKRIARRWRELGL